MTQRLPPPLPEADSAEPDGWSGAPGGGGPEVHGPEPPIRPAVIELLPPAGRGWPQAGPPPRHRWALAVMLFVITALTTTTLGAVLLLGTRTDATTDALPLLTPATVVAVWSDPAMLRAGLDFSLPALLILLCHELGHYLTVRAYGLPVTPPFFLPAPVGLGTFGAFIRIRAPIRSKRQLFDVGISGPLAGFVALVPFLLYGVAHSRPVSLTAAAAVTAPLPPGISPALLVPGKCLAIDLATRLFHGPLGDGEVLDLHPFALAAWFGLLATAINLLPLGQLDGGHILYAVTGRFQRRLALPLWVALGLAGVYWAGWLLWCLIVLLMGLNHPPVRDEATPVDRRRRVLACVALAILALSFMPVPLAVVPLR
jgi:membrane-associated protease RseP (regulator of RpoE activity)